jgi:hypothetical protein
MNEIIERLERILESAENHPCFAGWKDNEITEEYIHDEGGDIAFVTADICWPLADVIKDIKKGSK